MGNALEKKLTDQVQVDIAELRQKWVQLRVDRVTHHTFKLYQVREHLKHSKVLYVEEDQILSEFTRVKDALKTNSLDDDTFEATRDTCLVLGEKLGNIRKRQTRCYADTSDLELVINKDIVALKFEDKDFEDLDINQVRASTPVRQLSPTPLDRHRSRSREPSEFRMPAMKLSSGTTTPGGSIPADPHAYFSRPGSSQSMYGGKQGGDMDAFRTAMEAKQAKDKSPDNEISTDRLEVRSADGQIIAKAEENSLLSDVVFLSERPGSAMSDMSIDIDIDMVSRPGSKLEFIGDDISGKVVPLLVESEIIKKATQNKDLLDFDTNQFVEESVNAKPEATQIENLVGENVKTKKTSENNSQVNPKIVGDLKIENKNLKSKEEDNIELEESNNQAIETEQQKYTPLKEQMPSKDLNAKNCLENKEILTINAEDLQPAKENLEKKKIKKNEKKTSNIIVSTEMKEEQIQMNHENKKVEEENKQGEGVKVVEHPLEQLLDVKIEEEQNEKVMNVCPIERDLTPESATLKDVKSVENTLAENISEKKTNNIIVSSEMKEEQIQINHENKEVE